MPQTHKLRMDRRCEAAWLMTIVFRDILAARNRIAGGLFRTPLRHSVQLSEQLGVDVFLKFEHLQNTGSFKLRGALNAVAELRSAECKRGVIASSTGNHGRGLAYACGLEGVPLTVCMSQNAAQNKVAAIRALGAEIYESGTTADDADRTAVTMARTSNRTLLPPFDHPAIIAGQGTVGLEILEERPEIQAILCPLSGGGLLSGVGIAAKSINPDIELIGVCQERAPGMIASLKAGKPVEISEEPTLADALAGSIGRDNRWTFDLVRRLMDRSIAVAESGIAEAIHWAYVNERQVLEGAGAITIAAALRDCKKFKGPIALILSGGNIDMTKHQNLLGAP